MIVTVEIGSAPLSDLLKHLQAGDEVLLTEGSKPVARLVAALQKDSAPAGAFQVRSFKGHRVLTPIISGSDLADEMLGGTP